MVRMLTVFHAADPQKLVQELEWQQRLMSSDVTPKADTPEEMIAKVAAVRG